MEPPSLDSSIAGNIDEIANAIVVPPPKNEPNRSVQKSGVLTLEGEFVPRSVTWRGTSQVNTEPAMPPAEDIQPLEGRYMFAGSMFGHFGHFLVESCCRLWAVDELREKIDGIIYVPKFQRRPEHVLKVYTPLLQMLGVDCPIINAADPLKVETLLVPQQGFGMFEMIAGAPEFRDYMRKHAGRNVVPEGPEKLYVSRTALPPQRGGLLGESRLEALLEEEGYVVFHPQKHSLEEQVAHYKAARKIISIDGSPMHLLAFVGDEAQKVGIIARRDRNLDQIFAEQLKAFIGVDAAAISILKRNWIPERDQRPSRLSWGEVDFGELFDRLLEAELISSSPRWSSLSDDEHDTLIKEIEDGHKIRFKPYERDAA